MTDTTTAILPIEGIPRRRDLRKKHSAHSEEVQSVRRLSTFCGVVALSMTLVGGGLVSSGAYASPTPQLDGAMSTDKGPDPAVDMIINSEPYGEAIDVQDDYIYSPAESLQTSITAPENVSFELPSDATGASSQAPAPKPPTRNRVEQQRPEAPAPAEAKEEAKTEAPAPRNVDTSSIVATAKSLLGIPYVWGGSTLAGLDCSGFVQYVYAQNGISLPRTSYAQQAAGTIISPADAQPGDVLSWGYHVAIYIGDGMMIDEAQPGTVSSIHPIWGNPVYVRF